MNKIILADSQAIFRAGTAKVLAMDEDLRIIAQCTDVERMYHAISTFPGSIVIFAASLRPDFARLHVLLETVGSRGIVISENNELAGSYLQEGFRGVVFRSVTGPALVECVRRVAAGDTWMPPQVMQPDSPEEDMVGTRVRDAQGNANCGPDRSGLQESRNRTPSQDDRAGDQELPALNL
jgi:DNA-binding NarL/FixJ family response regulator